MIRLAAVCAGGALLSALMLAQAPSPPARGAAREVDEAAYRQNNIGVARLEQYDYEGAVAAFRRHGGPCIVVDFGTATTFDAVSAAGEYLGGAIAPGIETSLDALANRAARLVKVDLVAPDRAIGKSTTESMRSGIVYGTVAMVDGVCARMKEELGPDAVVVATGGLSSLVFPHSEQIDEVDPLLTLEGLRLVHELNVRKPAPTGEAR